RQPVHNLHSKAPALVRRPAKNQHASDNPDDSPLRLIWPPHHSSVRARILADPIRISFPAHSTRRLATKGTKGSVSSVLFVPFVANFFSLRGFTGNSTPGSHCRRLVSPLLLQLAACG